MRSELQIAAATPQRIKIGAGEYFASPLSRRRAAALEEAISHACGKPLTLEDPEGREAVTRLELQRTLIKLALAPNYNTITDAQLDELDDSLQPWQLRALIAVLFELDLVDPKAEATPTATS